MLGKSSGEEMLNYQMNVMLVLDALCAVRISVGRQWWVNMINLLSGTLCSVFGKHLTEGNVRV